jgi:drug/metabolite transporter (DMT)-like permease
VLTFPDLDFGFVGSEPKQALLKGAGAAFAAAALWAAATVIGRGLLRKLDPTVVSFWRFAFGLLGMSVAMAATGSWIPSGVFGPEGLWRSLLYMAFFPGLAAMLLYYKGLQGTEASVATFVELIFPLSAVVLNAWVLGLGLAPAQYAAGGVLIAAVAALSVGSGRLESG